MGPRSHRHSASHLQGGGRCHAWNTLQTPNLTEAVMMMLTNARNGLHTHKCTECLSQYTRARTITILELPAHQRTLHNRSTGRAVHAVARRVTCTCRHESNNYPASESLPFARHQTSRVWRTHHTLACVGQRVPCHMAQVSRPLQHAKAQRSKAPKA